VFDSLPVPFWASQDYPYMIIKENVLSFLEKELAFTVAPREPDFAQAYIA
jgi:hypothetical protein